MGEQYIIGSFILMVVIDFLLLLAFDTIINNSKNKILIYLIVAIVTGVVNIGYICFLTEYLKNV